MCVCVVVSVLYFDLPNVFVELPFVLLLDYGFYQLSAISDRLPVPSPPEARSCYFSSVCSGCPGPVIYGSPSPFDCPEWVLTPTAQRRSRDGLSSLPCVKVIISYRSLPLDLLQHTSKESREIPFLLSRQLGLLRLWFFVLTYDLILFDLI